MKVLGIVKDAATGVPLPGAKIRLYVREEELAVLQSDSEGTFEHKSDSQYIGEILICKVEKAGYEPQKVIQEFEEDEVTLAIKLVPGKEEKIEFTVNLKDEKRNPLKGVNISLEVDGEGVGVGISDKDGVFKISLSPDLEGKTINYKAELAGFVLASGALLLKKETSHEITMKKLSVPPSDEKKEIKKIKKMSNERPWYGKPEIIIPAIVVILAAIIGGIFVLISSPQLPTTPLFKEIGGDTDADGDYEISWESSERVISYILQEDRNHSFINPRTVYIGSETKANIYGKSNGGYYYRARACNKAGESEWSSIRKITVMLSPLLTPTSTSTQTPPVALTQTLPPSNNPPDAFVDSINPNPARQEQSVTFSCHGDDSDSGDYINEYKWESSIDGFLSNQKTFSISSLSSGLHQIILRVKDSHGQWSSEITRNLRVEAIEIPSTEIDDTTPDSVPSITPAEIFAKTIDMEFVLIPAGEFEMGSPSDEEGRSKTEGPVHHVNIEKAFYMGKYEVTQKQWRAIMGDNPSNFKGDDLPVEKVIWDEVQEFIKKLNEEENTNKYRLPSEAEWEYACRAGTTTRYSFGDSESKLGDYAWYRFNSDTKTHPVGQKKPNSWGLYDMCGNVWEWVQDSWHDSYNGAPADGSAWEGDGAGRVIRGGCFNNFVENYRSADRRPNDPRLRHDSLGFRLLKSL